MPSDPVPLFIVCRRPGRAAFRSVSLEDLTAVVRIYRAQMTITRDEMKALRLKAMSVVGEHMQANADMFGRVIAAGDKVAAARVLAETAQLGALNEQIADLNEMASDLEGLAQASPLSSTAKPAAATVTPATASDASAALDALNTAQPPSLSRDAWTKGDAYEGTHPDTAKSST